MTAIYDAQAGFGRSPCFIDGNYPRLSEMRSLSHSAIPSQSTPSDTGKAPPPISTAVYDFMANTIPFAEHTSTGERSGMPNKFAHSPSRGLLTVLTRGWALIATVAILAGLGGLAFSLLQKPMYEASSTLFISSGGAAAYDVNMDKRVETYAQLVYSDAILTPALKAANLDWSLTDAREAVGVESNPQVVMITVSARANDPATAKKFDTALGNSLIDAVSTLEGPRGDNASTIKLSVVTPATLASSAVAPNTQVNVAIATVLGLFIGIVLVLLREALNKKVRDSKDAETALDTRTLAVIPGAGVIEEGQLVDFDGDPTPIATSFRDLASRLKVELRHHPNPKLLVTSARSDEGKTTVAVNIGTALAHGAYSVVVVGPSLGDAEGGDIYDASTGRGLADAITGRIAVSDAVQRGVGGLDTLAILSVGRRAVGAPEDLLLSAAFPKVLEELAHEFDYVIIDGPALLDNVGTEAVLPSIDGVVLVTRPGVSTVEDLVECRNRLSRAETRVLGVVLSEQRHERSRHRSRLNQQQAAGGSHPRSERSRF